MFEPAMLDLQPPQWLRTAVVNRYDILPDLATSGVGRLMNLYLTLEWHRNVKQAWLGSREKKHMRLLDDTFVRYPIRCGDGSCSMKSIGEVARLTNSTLMGTLEKTLTYMLHRAGITYADAFNHKLSAEGPGLWNATRARLEDMRPSLTGVR